MTILPFTFYRRSDVLTVAEDLMGKLLVTRWNGMTTSGRIVECEA
ncbi:MAG: DNA-3-methyladenine glycosylase, partial [Chitinophagaceae bacterium]|nr:DNA-3-methyladenine glycosylase [Chitinophagaceae bacterium]